MSKFTVIVLLGLTSQGLAAPLYSVNNSPLRNSNLEEVSGMLRSVFDSTMSDVLKDGNYDRSSYHYSANEVSVSSRVNENGVVREEHKGIGVINDNGRVSVYKPERSQPSFNFPRFK